MIQALSERIRLFVQLGQYIKKGSDALYDAIKEAGLKNLWFTEPYVRKSLVSIQEAFLQEDALLEWAGNYAMPSNRHATKTVGLILAGNIPLVGFHDVLCVILSGHKAMIKLSEKDSVLLQHLLTRMVSQDERMANHFVFVDQLSGFDAIIATGSNNSARYFEAYFQKYPHIIRRNRNGVAVLDGDESPQEIAGLCVDVMDYFGMGCRNVSALFVPQEWTPDVFLKATEHFEDRLYHSRYMNNYDYQLAILLLSKSHFFQSNTLLLKEDHRILSSLSTLHLIRYTNDQDLRDQLERHREDIQCLVSAKPIPGWTTIRPGQSQKPGLMDYADGIDTMQFINGLAE